MSEKQTVKFGDICREVKLTTKDPIADGYERYIGLEHLDSGSLKIKRWGMIAEDNPSFTRVFKKGHILFGKRRPYLKKAVPLDPWQTPYQYKQPGEHNSEDYDLYSFGADRSSGGSKDNADIGNW